MSPAKAEKAFDCLAYKERVQEEIYGEIKGLTPQQQIAYYNHSSETGPLATWWKAVRRASPRSPGLVTRQAKQ